MDEKEKGTNKTFSFLLEALNDSTEEAYKTRQREINLLQQLLDTHKKITSLIGELAKTKFGQEVKQAKEEIEKK